VADDYAQRLSDGIDSAIVRKWFINFDYEKCSSLIVCD
jgi:hypothetical protein